MIDVSYRKIIQPELHEAFLKVSAYTGFTAKTAYRVGRMKDFMEQALRRVHAKKLELAKQHGELDEKGKPLTEQGDVPGMSRLKIKPESKEAYDKACEDFYAEVFSMKVHKIPFTELEKAQLSGDEMALLADFIDGVPGDEDDAQGNEQT